MKFKFILLIIVFFYFAVAAQEKKTVEVKYVTKPIVIDAVLDDSAYLNAFPAKDFVQLQPYNGKPSFQPSEAYFFYDQTAIYVGAMLYDSAPDSIFNYLSERDEIGMSDYFGVYFDPYNQGQVAYGFFVTPAGVQTDLKATKSDGDNEDGNWNAVWQSKTRVTDKGWIVEMRIPYSALRFSDKAGQIWGLNMFRNIRRYNSNNSWSLVDRKISGFIHQEGQMTGVKDIKPPVRLSFSPYAATYIESNSGKQGTDFIYKGGLDLKYGLSESFTLDMMLIPDFGQIQSDDKELNLSPYELYYDEKRQFFTEGTELFQRGNIFYSRRIGAKPKFTDRADDERQGEIVISNPRETQLVNASKISGRTSGGWGLGFLNAMSLPAYSTVRDTNSGVERKVLSQPFTNYNVSVVDKSIRNNGYISLINSNISMFNDPFRANVTATDFQIRDKSKKFAIKGKGGISTRGETKYETGYFASLALEKNKGNFKYGFLQTIYNDKYNPNDLGYLRRNNEMLSEWWIYYQIIEPFWIIREWQSNVWWDHTRVVTPSKLFCNNFGVYSFVLFKNNYYFEMNGGLETDKNNYYETRVKNRFLFEPYYYWINLWVGTDSRKRVRLTVHYGGNAKPDNDELGSWGNASLNVRVGQHLQFNYNSGYEFEINNRGYIGKNDEETIIYFARRNVKTIENVFETSYAINNKASLRFRTRHYWSGALNKNFYQLQNNGSLLEDITYSHDNKNYNVFNVDMIFRWIFAPGSELSLAWKNAIADDNGLFINNYWNNIDKTWQADKINSVSLKILYYIDYNNIRKHKK
jgi:hypothetical protein